MNLCIFRNINNCKSCCFKTRGKYCNLHANNENIIYEIVNDAIGIKQITSAMDIYTIFAYIYNNPDIYTKELVFRKILKTLFIKQSFLTRIFQKYITNDNDIISSIFELNKTTYVNRWKLEHLKKIKRFFCFILIKNHKYNLNITYVNENDPFTMELIQDIPKKNSLFLMKI